MCSLLKLARTYAYFYLAAAPCHAAMCVCARSHTAHTDILSHTGTGGLGSAFNLDDVGSASLPAPVHNMMEEDDVDEPQGTF